MKNSTILIGTNDPIATQQVIDILTKSDINKETKVVVMGENMVTSNLIILENDQIIKAGKVSVLGQDEEEELKDLVLTLMQHFTEGTLTTINKIYKLTNWTFEETKYNVLLLEKHGYVKRSEENTNEIAFIFSKIEQAKYLQKQLLRSKQIATRLRDEFYNFVESNKIDKSELLSDTVLDETIQINLPIVLHEILNNNQEEITRLVEKIKSINSHKKEVIINFV